MRFLDNIERMGPPASWTEFLRLRAGRPAIITGLFKGQAILRLRDEASARGALGSMDVSVVETETRDMRRLLSGLVEPRASRMSFAALLDAARRRPRCRLVAREQDVPAEIRRLLRPPRAWTNMGGEKAAFYLFAATRGAATHLHYDTDQRHAFLFQVFGRKRAVVIDPLQAAGLRSYGNTSARFLESYSDAAKLRFLRRAKAYEAVLHPGETLFIPMLSWHYMEYLDTAMSVGIRLGREIGRRFLGDAMPVDVNVQRVSAWIARQGRSPESRGVTARIEAAYRALGDMRRIGPLELRKNYAAMQRLFRRLHRSIWGFPGQGAADLRRGAYFDSLHRIAPEFRDCGRRAARVPVLTGSKTGAILKR